MKTELEELKDKNLRYHEALTLAIEGLSFYGDPSIYHGISFIEDRPSGSFSQDFTIDPEDEFYNRPMPGANARQKIIKIAKILSSDLNKTKNICDTCGEVVGYCGQC